MTLAVKSPYLIIVPMLGVDGKYGIIRSMNHRQILRSFSMKEKLNSPQFKPSEIVKLPEQMDHHNHGYNQVVIGLSGQTEFDIEGAGNLVCPGQGCLVTADSEHAFSGIGNNEILVLNVAAEQYQASYTQDHIAQLFDQSSYFHLDRQAQNLIQALTAEMAAHPDDLLLSRACTDTLMCVLHRHFKPLKDDRQTYRLNMDVIDQYILQHLTRKIIGCPAGRTGVFGGKPVSLLVQRANRGNARINMY